MQNPNLSLHLPPSHYILKISCLLIIHLAPSEFYFFYTHSGPHPNPLKWHPQALPLCSYLTCQTKSLYKLVPLSDTFYSHLLTSLLVLQISL